MERKKRLIIFSIIITSVLLIVVLSSALFSFRTVSVECRTNTFVITQSDHQKIIDSGDFKYGKNILFINFKKNIENIELKNPYVKVINIERKFPNYAIINIKERMPAVKLSTTGGKYILDEDLKVLNVVKTSSGYNEVLNEDKLPELIINQSAGISYNKDKSAGEFLENEALKRIVSAFYNGVVIGENGEDEVIGEDRKDETVAKSCITIIKDITVNFEPTSRFNCLKYTLTFDGSSCTADVYDDSQDKLVENIYKTIKIFIDHSDKYTKIECRNGAIYGDKTQLS